MSKDSNSITSRNFTPNKAKSPPPSFSSLEGLASIITNNHTPGGLKLVDKFFELLGLQLSDIFSYTTDDDEKITAKIKVLGFILSEGKSARELGAEDEFIKSSAKEDACIELTKWANKLDETELKDFIQALKDKKLTYQQEELFKKHFTQDNDDKLEVSVNTQTIILEDLHDSKIESKGGSYADDHFNPLNLQSGLQLSEKTKGGDNSQLQLNPSTNGNSASQTITLNGASNTGTIETTGRNDTQEDSENDTDVFTLITNRITDLDKQLKTILKDLKSCTDKKTEESYVKAGEKAYNEMIFLQSIEPINIKYVSALSLYQLGNIYRDQAIKLGSLEKTKDQVEIIVGVFSKVINLYKNAIKLEEKQPSIYVLIDGMKHNPLIAEMKHNLGAVTQAHKTLKDVLNWQPGEGENFLQPVDRVDENVGVIGANDYEVLQPGE